MEEEGRFKKDLPKYMMTLDGENKTKEEKDQLWQDLINQSEHKLIFIDCYVAWCGACEVECTSTIILIYITISLVSHSLVFSLYLSIASPPLTMTRCDVVSAHQLSVDHVRAI